MLRIACLLLFIAGTGVAKGQTIRGCILDSLTGNPLKDVSVYVNKTTKGTISDENGFFELTYTNYPFQLIFSHISYEPRIMDMNNALSGRLKVTLAPKYEHIQELAIYDKNERDNLVSYFEDSFLGTDDWGKSASIVNDSVLFFMVEYYANPSGREYDHQIKKMEVTATEPIHILLPDLGYELYYTLLEYREICDLAHGSITTLLRGFRHYNEIIPEEGRQKKQIERNRFEAYYNSPRHFLRSLCRKELKQNGYELTNWFLDHDIDSTHKLVYTQIEEAGDMTRVVGLKDKWLPICYIGKKRTPLNLQERDVYFAEPVYSEARFLKDTVIINKDGITEDYAVMFAPVMGSKRIGATLPADYYPEKHY